MVISILNIAISPGVNCKIFVSSATCKKGRIKINLPNLWLSYFFTKSNQSLGRDLLVDAVIRFVTIPSFIDLEIDISSDVPPGSSTGTSAAVLVSLIGAINKLNGVEMLSTEIVRKAHEIETIELKRNAGVQDYICSVKGGLSFISMKGYPNADFHSLKLDTETLNNLDSRLLLIFLGLPHESSSEHMKFERELGISSKYSPSPN